MFRLLCVKSRVGLLSILALVVTLGVATDALACKFTGLNHYCATTKKFGLFAGSVIATVAQPGDYELEIIAADPGFFNANWHTADGQKLDCTYDGQPAFCTAAVSCFHFAIGQSCSKGKRSSKMECPTTPANGSPGCSGSITVELKNGVFPGGSNTKTVTFAVDPTIDKQCNQEFPRIPGVLSQGVIGEIVQSCTQDPWSAEHIVLSSVVRDDLNNDFPSETYMERSDGGWLTTTGCDANPDNGFPTGACTNDGGAWITVLNDEFSDPVVIPKLCAASAKQLTCGTQVVDGDVLSGPPPKECKVDSKGNCTCRCARCNPEGTLVNLSGGTFGTFVLADEKGVSGTRPWAAVCRVTVTGN
jgi:hypothetical protein